MKRERKFRIAVMATLGLLTFLTLNYSLVRAGEEAISVAAFRAAAPLTSGTPYAITLESMTYINVYIDVPDGATKLTVKTTDGSGDLDLYMKFGSKISGNTVSELDASADIRADGPTADETIEITPDTTPALKQGKWYIAVLNLNSNTTSFKVTATYEAAAKTDHQITSTPTPEVATSGAELSWSYEITPGTISGEVDLVTAIMLPNGSLLFFTDEGLRSELGTYRWGFSVEETEKGFILFDLPFPSGLPTGYYTFFTLLVRSGNIITDTNNWVSNLASSTVYFAPLSPSQLGLVNESGYPERFIKSFSEEDLGKRVDETWIYAKEGVIRSFANAGYMGQEEISVDSTAQANPARPEHYNFDTTIAAVTSKHGTPAAIQTNTVWSGTFKNYIYSDIAFGFLNNTLASVISVEPATSAAANKLNWMVPSTPLTGVRVSKGTAATLSSLTSSQSPGKSSPNSKATAAIRSKAATAPRIPAVRSATEINTGILCTFASLLGVAAHEGVQGAQGAYDTCIAGIETAAPTAEDLKCFKDSLNVLSVQSTNRSARRGGLADWLWSLWTGARSHETTGTTTYPDLDRGKPGQTGYASLSASPKNVADGDLVHFRFVCAKKVLGQDLSSVTISGYGLPSSTMSKTGEGVYGFDWTAPDFPLDYRPLYVGTATYGGGKTITSSVQLFPIGKLEVELYPTTSALYSYPITWQICLSVSQGKPPYLYQWDFAGETGSTTTSADSRWIQRVLTSPGTYSGSVTVTDARGSSASAGATATVFPPRLRAWFSTQTSPLETGVAGQWCVDASGGTPPYLYVFAFSEGGGNSGSNCATNSFSTPGVKTLTVEVQDASDDYQSTTIGCQIVVESPPAPPCTPPECCPEYPTQCRSGCMPTGAWCCENSNYCLSGPCCGDGCCESAASSCCGAAACCNSAVDCCFEKTGVAGCCAGGNCCASGGCCEPGEECCGSLCCKSGSHCEGGTCVAD